MSDLHVHVQLLPPPHHGPVGHVNTITGSAEWIGEELTKALRDASLDATIAAGGCLSITIQRVPVPPR